MHKQLFLRHIIHFLLTPFNSLSLILLAAIGNFSVAEVMAYYIFTPIKGDDPSILNWSILAVWVVVTVYLAVLSYRNNRT
ncbi:hypothetical protein DSCO28_02940 [Desulfosarcina ovata subsp. sediminis]|uniref:Uncharacterized protein n=1 Tax=Desulfosarcina ovata subsp. sediminis TaxID=885957 RepID=A0A5K7ZC42_9BACT|nr:hypothetical protein DSCO28_02940 [Desulfosarcina ovata subsp. sediminis]